ncbi:MAG: methyltransferase [Deltaproteobacteria bacterium]|nr:methyltransferase [Deltaproteobacteria bacterium]MCW5804353.1 methyltransferase [Deltaproteobacteria bacterium]
MRWVLAVVVALGCASCERNEAQGGPSTGSGTSRTDETAKEQERFDKERKPEKVVEALGIKPGSRVADIGAGSGLLTVHLARAVKPNGKVVATDIDQQVLDLMYARLSAAGLADLVERRVVGADSPDLEEGQYDAILLAEVDHYFSDPIAWLHDATKALRPGGRIVISNRLHRRTKSMATAEKAGLVLKGEPSAVDTHFIAVFVAPPGKDP